MEPITAAEAGVWKLRGRRLGGGERIFPCLAALPMGWTHALYWCQSIHERLVSDIPGLEPDRLIVDRRATGVLGDGRHTICVSNLIIFGTSEALVRQRVQAARERLGGAGVGNPCGGASHHSGRVPRVGVRRHGRRAAAHRPPRVAPDKGHRMCGPPAKSVTG